MIILKEWLIIRDLIIKKIIITDYNHKNPKKIIFLGVYSYYLIFSN